MAQILKHSLNEIKKVFYWPSKQSYIELHNGSRYGVSNRAQVEEIFAAAKAAGYALKRSSLLGECLLIAPAPQPQPAPVIERPQPQPVEAKARELAEVDWATQRVINRIYTQWGLRNPATGRFMRSSYRERGVNY